MGKSKARSSRQKLSQQKTARQPKKPFWRKPVVWLGGVGTVVLAGVLVNVLSTQAQRIVPPLSSAPASKY